MAEAIARSVIGAGMIRKEEIVAADVSAARREVFARQIGVRAVEKNEEAAAGARMILLSVKPQQMKDVLGGIGGVISVDAWIVSIAAGVSAGFIERKLGGGRGWRGIRAMPCTSMAMGKGGGARWG